MLSAKRRDGAMLLVVGRLGAGKREFVKREFGYSDADIAVGMLDSRPVISDVQELLRTGDIDNERLFSALVLKDVVICNEVGCGVVPLDPAERAWRDAVGRLSVRLAARADKVVRICCGLPAVIKDSCLCK